VISTVAQQPAVVNIAADPRVAPGRAQGFPSPRFSFLDAGISGAVGGL